MRNSLVVLLLAGLFTACGVDGEPVMNSAVTDLEFEAMLVDSIQTWALGLTVTNTGQTSVRIHGPTCGVYATIQEAPDGERILPGEPPDGYWSPVCTPESQLDFELGPGESWTKDNVYIPRYDGLVDRVVAQPHWFAVGIFPGLIEGIDEPHVVDIGWVQMPLPRGWPTD